MAGCPPLTRNVRLVPRDINRHSPSARYLLGYGARRLHRRGDRKVVRSMPCSVSIAPFELRGERRQIRTGAALCRHARFDRIRAR